MHVNFQLFHTSEGLIVGVLERFLFHGVVDFLPLESNFLTLSKMNLLSVRFLFWRIYQVVAVNWRGVRRSGVRVVFDSSLKIIPT